MRTTLTIYFKASDVEECKNTEAFLVGIRTSRQAKIIDEVTSITVIEAPTQNAKKRPVEYKYISYSLPTEHVRHEDQGLAHVFYSYWNLRLWRTEKKH